MRNAEDHLLARLRFRHLQLIAAVDRMGSLSAAAVTLNLTQPALSKALKEVEDMLGFAIFYRSARGLQKTPQGAVVANGALLLLRELAHVHAEAREAGADGDLAAVLRLGASAYLAVGFLPPVVRRLTSLSPPLAIWLREDTVPNLFAALVAGDLDALVTLYNPDVMANAGADIRFEKISEERYVVIAPRGHALTDAGPVSWATLAAAPWVLTRKPSLARVFIDERFRSHGLMPPQPLCETDGPITAARMVAAGVGLSSVPETTANEACRNGDVSLVTLEAPQPSAMLGLVYRIAAASHPRVALLRQALPLAETSSD